MRPLHLHVHGLQAFSDPVDIDFESLGSSGLFGIFGPVGAGKSTLLDAIGLALYGDVDRGQGASRRGLRHPQASRVTVRFRFEDGTGERWRIERQYRDDKQGGLVRSYGRLIREGEGGGVVAELERDFNTEISRLVGLSREDFRRAVILPQGRFQELLQLRGGDRRNMLERIFDLAPYGENLRAGIREREAALRTQEALLEGEATGLRSAVELDLEASEVELAAARQVTLHSEERTRTARAGLVHAVDRERRWRALQAANEAEQAARAAWVAASGDRERLRRATRAAQWEEPIRRRDDARARWTDASSVAEAATTRARRATERADDARQARSRADQAEALRGPWTAWTTARDARLAASAACQREREVVERLDSRWHEAERQLSDLTGQRERAEVDAEAAREVHANWRAAEAKRHEHDVLQRATERVNRSARQLDARRNELRAAAEAVAAARRDWSVADADLRQLREQLGQVDDLPAEDPAPWEKRIARHQALLVDQARRRVSADRAASTSMRAAEALASARTLRDGLAAALEEACVEAARRATRDRAAHLALDLADGSPCPVCGATEHPHPASAPGAAAPQPDPEPLAAAEASLRRAEADAAAAEARARAAQAEVDAVAGEIAALADPAAPDVASWIARAAGARESQLAKASAKELATRIAATERTVDALRVRAEEAEATVAAARRSLDEADLEAADARRDTPQEALNLLVPLRRLTTGPEPDVAGAEAHAKALRFQLDAATTDRANLQAELQQARIRLGAAEATLIALGPETPAPPEPMESAPLPALVQAAADHAHAAERAALEAADAERDLATARGALDQAERALQGVPVDAVGDDPLDAGTREQLTARLKALDDALANTERARLAADTDFADAPPALDAAAASLAVERAEQDERRARTAQADVEARAELAAVHAPRRAELASLGQAVKVELARLHTLAARLRKHDFVTWLADDALRDLVRRASVHLLVLTDDRYRFDVDGDGAFQVVDTDYGDAVRPTSGLSGGETFLASLALALALSESIAARSQRRLDFFFLDEGFGSLDAESLDRAMTALEALPRGHRVVGLVSHVPGVRERLSKWLEVLPASAGRGARVVEHGG